jgi:hypothetical protein
MQIIEWITAHWQDILAIWGGLVVVATVIVKMTPSQRDDKILAWVVKLFDQFSVVNPKGTKVTKE